MSTKEQRAEWARMSKIIAACGEPDPDDDDAEGWRATWQAGQAITALLADVERLEQYQRDVAIAVDPAVARLAALGGAVTPLSVETLRESSRQLDETLVENNKLRADVERLNERLENNHIFECHDGEMVRVEVEPGKIPDGIGCRNATIDLLTEKCERLDRELDCTIKDRKEIIEMLVDRDKEAENAIIRAEKAERERDEAMQGSKDLTYRIEELIVERNEAQSELAETRQSETELELACRDLDRAIDEAREELATWRSVFPGQSPDDVMPGWLRLATENAELRAEIANLRAQSTLAKAAIATNARSRLRIRRIAKFDGAKAEAALGKKLHEARAQINAMRAQLAQAKEALEPFAAVGNAVGDTFGPALFPDDDQAFPNGCVWTENGETKILTWANFRAAHDVLAAIKGE